MSEHVAFVESNTTGSGRLAVERLLAAGSRVTFLARRPEIYPFLREARPGLTVVGMETNDLEVVVDRLLALGAERPFDALVTFSEYYVITVAEVAGRLGHRYLSPRAARTCRDKHRLRRVLAEAGRPGPWFRLLRSEEEARLAAAEVGYPCVAKPTGDSSSKGVRKIGGPDELMEHFRELSTWKLNDRGQPSGGEVLVEAFLEGEEVSVETFSSADGSLEVVGVCRKHLSEPPLFVELGHDFPAPLDAEVEARLRAEVTAALAAVGFDFGPAHVELRLTPKGPVVVEVNPRLAGGMIPELVQHALGIDLLEAYLDLLCGREADLRPRRREHASIRFLTADRRGRLEGVRGLEEARAVDGVREVTLTKPTGAEVQPAEHALHRLGFVIASAPEGERAAAAAGRAAAAVSFEIGGGHAEGGGS